jgi:acyl transferase domain-containing protein
VASVTKAALTLHHRQLAPQATLNRLNRRSLRRAPDSVITEAEPFPADYTTAAVAVNGFGYGGTNAHAVLVEAPKPTRPVVRQAPAQVLPVSGRNEVGARQLARELLPLVADPAVDPVALVDAMWSRRRPHSPVRRAVRRPR